jgi:8-oxo-dGTP pyrophosphatase MutT (NUDIX family)
VSLEKSAGAVVFRKENNEIFYLLLRYPSRNRGARAPYWDLPKGHIEKGETEIDTARREIKEETGLDDIKFIDGFKEQIKYYFRVDKETVFKTVVFFLAQTEKEKIIISPEHIDYKWLPYNEALKQLSFKNTKEVLRKANEFLLKNNHLLIYKNANS